MQLKIGKETYELTFGIGFLREIDKVRGLEEAGMRMGVGLTFLLPALMASDVLAIYDVIKAGTSNLPQKPSEEAIEGFLAEADLEKLAKDFFDALEKAQMTKQTVKRFVKSMNK